MSYFEILTLKQTRKLGRSICIVLYWSCYWREILNLEALARHGVISETDLNLFTTLTIPAAHCRS